MHIYARPLGALTLVHWVLPLPRLRMHLAVEFAAERVGHQQGRLRDFYPYQVFGWQAPRHRIIPPRVAIAVYVPPHQVAQCQLVVNPQQAVWGRNGLEVGACTVGGCESKEEEVIVECEGRRGFDHSRTPHPQSAIG